ncbi:MAG: hypothetical protein LBQ32_06545 [Burkholderiaceae bacterium]|jgi:hypothetical protein|nr:hypothetical protein [Burkholderiaceae bacterium]
MRVCESPIQTCDASPPRKSSRRGLWGALLTAACLLGLLAPLPALAQTPFATISSPAGKLISIYVGNELGTQVVHQSDSTVTPPVPQGGQAYPSGSVGPADYGTFLVVGGVLYSPDFGNHAGSAAGNANPSTPFTPVSQTGVTGTGTAADPFKVVTTVAAGATGITATQTVTYVIGQDTFATTTVVSNSTAAAVPVLLYRAMDCYMGGSDSGFGMVDSNSVACTRVANSTGGQMAMAFSLPPGSNYFEGSYSALWSWIGTQAPFANTCDCAIQIDNAMGYSLAMTVPAAGSVTDGPDSTTFSPTGTIGPTPPPPSAGTSPVPALAPEALAALALLMAALGVAMTQTRRRKNSL